MATPPKTTTDVNGYNITPGQAYEYPCDAIPKDQQKALDAEKNKIIKDKPGQNIVCVFETDESNPNGKWTVKAAAKNEKVIRATKATGTSTSQENSEEENGPLQETDEWAEVQDPNSANYAAFQEILESDYAFSGMDVQITDAHMADQLKGIFGMPYQFSDIVDPVPLISKNDTGDNDTGSAQTYEEDTNHIGRKFNEKILSVAPLLFLTPGSPSYMQGYNTKIVQKMTQALTNVIDLDSETANTKFDDGRYYTFKGDFQEYSNYANLALRTLGLFLGIDHYKIPIPGGDKTVEIGKINIRDFFEGNKFAKRMGTLPFIGFYLDASDSISEGFNNGTTESSLSSMANGYSSTAREVEFLLGNDTKSIINAAKSKLTEAGQNVADAMSQLGDTITNGAVITRVTNELTTIVTGGKIVFPELWSDSSYSKNFDISLKLRSPDPDPVSIFLNIFLPIILLVSMAAPRQRGNSSNAFKSPFLVRAVYKSMFCCDLGIIEGINITRGGDYRWNKIGLPLSADVSISLKDLYSTMFISKSFGLINNTAQLDYLSNMAGMNILEEEYFRNLRVLKLIAANKPADIVRNFVYGVGEKVVRRVTRFGSKFWLGSNIAN